MSYTFISILIFLIILLIASLYFCIKFALIIIKMQDVIEESLDVIDEKYINLSKILDIPIFYNSPEIKGAVEEVKETREVLLYIANQLVKDKKTLDKEVNIEDKKEEV
tara:strand:+ start:369 stop:692 length:324 start_codon:yes stop_codon:yes gene_type:complete